MKPSLILPGIAAVACALAVLPACDRNDRNDGSVMNQRTTDETGTTSGTSASGTSGSTTSTTTTDTTGTTGAAGTAGSTAGTGTSGSAAGMGSSSASKSGAAASKSGAGHSAKKNKKSGAATGKEEGDINGTAGGTGDKHMSRNEETLGSGEDEITIVETEDRLPSSTDSTSGATTGAADIDMNAHNPARGLDPLMALEPYSRIPVHIGSVQVTGKDKSVAILESTSRFIDPNALARNESGMIATIPIANLDLDKFGPGDRHAFQSAMMTRLGNLDHRLDHIRASTMSSVSAPRVEIRDRLAMLEGRHSALEEQVDYADTVGQDRWDSFKTGFRDQLATFEKDLANLSVSAR